MHDSGVEYVYFTVQVITVTVDMVKLCYTLLYSAINVLIHAVFCEYF